MFFFFIYTAIFCGNGYIGNYEIIFESIYYTYCLLLVITHCHYQYVTACISPLKYFIKHYIIMY